MQFHDIGAATLVILANVVLFAVLYALAVIILSRWQNGLPPLLAPHGGISGADLPSLWRSDRWGVSSLGGVLCGLVVLPVTIFVWGWGRIQSTNLISFDGSWAVPAAAGLGWLIMVIGFVRNIRGSGWHGGSSVVVQQHPHRYALWLPIGVLGLTFLTFGWPWVLLDQLKYAVVDLAP